MHLPKTAGSAFRKLLEEQYGTDAAFCYHPEPRQVEENLRQALPKKPSLLAAHFDASQLNAELRAAYKIVTFLRHPVERNISHYLFVKHSPWPMHQELFRQWQNFEGFLQSPFAQNFQCRFLSGYRLKDLTISENELLQISLEQLKTIDGLGITEFYEDSVWLLARRYHWKKLRPKKINESPHLEAAKNLQQQYQSPLIRQNMADLALYKEALQRHFAERGKYWVWKKRLRRLGI